MGKFNPDNYETVKERKKRFYKDYPEGRIIVKNIISKEDYFDAAMFEVSIYLNPDEQERGLPKATGCAFEVRDKELSATAGGKQYESVNYTSWTENCEESAIGRALDNAGYSGNNKCSREEMEKSERMKSSLDKSRPTTKQIQYMTNLAGEQFSIDLSKPEDKKLFHAVVKETGIDISTSKGASDCISKMKEDSKWMELVGNKLVRPLD